MANHTWTSAPYGNIDPQFRAWASGISNALSTIGLVRVEASTVASNWGNVVAGYANDALNTEYAWEVWAFPSSATQIASPIFLRFGYGIGATRYRMQATIKCSTTQGSGGVTTGIGGSGSFVVNGGSGSSSTVTTSYAASDGHGLVLAQHIDSSTAALRTIFVVDRPRNADGTPLLNGLLAAQTYDGLIGVGQHVFDLTANEYLSYGSGIPPAISFANFSASQTYLNDVGQAQLVPWWFVAKNWHGVSKMICGHAVLDLAGLTNHQAFWLPSTGTVATRTVKSLAPYFVSGTIDAWGSPGATVAIWWAD